jgi:polyhydroxybutyrate depolymerase
MRRLPCSLLAAVALCAVPARADYLPQGEKQELGLRVAGGERWVTVYRPAGYRAGAPAVLLLHGGTQSMRKILSADAGGTRQWLAIADRERFLLLIPNATNAATGDTRGDIQTWNDLRPDGAAGQSRADDVAFLVQLLDWAQERYRWDAKRVYVTGASNGGMMTMRLLLERPERFAAAAAFIASLPARPPAPPAAGRRVPLLLLNGTRDPLIRWPGGQVRGNRGETMPVEAMVQWWRAVNGVADVRADSETLPDLDPGDGCRLHRTTWAGTAPVVFYRAEGGGHALPSIAHRIPDRPLVRRLIGPVCRDAEGAELAWAFFREHGAR